MESIDKNEASRLFFESRSSEHSDATLKLDRTAVNQFIGWIEHEDLNYVTARDLHRFKLFLQSEYSKSTVAMRYGKIRIFLSFVASIDGIDADVPEKMQVPSRNGQARDDTVEPDRAEAILEHLRKFEYASKRHAMCEIVWHTGIRTGTLRSLDLDDFQADEERLRIRHRPETDTPLKNGASAERYVALSSKVTDVVADYIDHNRKDVGDEYGREPLFTTYRGRVRKDGIRAKFYSATRPCMVGSCPYDTRPSDCTAANRLSRAYACDGTLSGHPWRRGSITQHLRDDVPPRVVSDRANVSQKVLDRHYDVRTEDEKAEQRRSILFGG